MAFSQKKTRRSSLKSRCQSLSIDYRNSRNVDRSTRFWVGDSLTFADLLAFSYLDDVRVLFSTALEKFAELQQLRGQIAARPRISDYLQSEGRPAAVYLGPDGRPVVDPESKNPAPDRFW